MKRTCLLLCAWCLACAGFAQDVEYPCWSGIYPHLANFNSEGECGTGAVVPWADKLWMISYGPHSPYGSSDRLHAVDADLNKVTCPESTGGTHANRMIHPESNQLFIGCYAIDAEGKVRVISWRDMPGRLTGCARHLTDPENRIYFATMEEGFYDVDVRTLAVTQMYPDSNRKPEGYVDILPGYHGKGFYSAQGRIVYANNGEQSPRAMRFPETESGCLAQWSGKDWEVVLRNQFTEVTGPGGIRGNANPDDLLWSVGWDYRSVMLMVLKDGKWTKFRLPKASHCYDGAHGWNTEWPRIREIGAGNDYLMTMHGAFWHFPNDFCPENARGIRPRSTYMKVVGDFCFWNGRVVCGCDDTAKSEFMNKSPFKGKLAEPGQSNSNLWFLDPAALDTFGPPLGRGAVWFTEPVKANTPSEPYLFAGYDYRAAFLSSGLPTETVTFTFEIQDGDGNWRVLKSVPVTGTAFVAFDSKTEAGEWVRVTSDKNLDRATCFFQYRNADARSEAADGKFDGLAASDSGNYTGGLLWVRPDNKRLAVLPERVENNQLAEGEAFYELTENSELVPVEKDKILAGVRERVAVGTLAENVFAVDDSSVVCTVEGKKFRLPIGCEALVRTEGALPLRLDREVATERDLFHCAGTFYELPAINAGGLPKVRPVATDGRRITDYASYRGLMVLTGLENAAIADLAKNPEHIIRSADGKAAVWAGAIDDLWAFGKPRGFGWLWKNSTVAADETSLPFLMTGFDRKILTFTNHGAGETARFTLEFDITGTGEWVPFATYEVGAQSETTVELPPEANAYWLRTRAGSAGTVSVKVEYK